MRTASQAGPGLRVIPEISGQGGREFGIEHAEAPGSSVLLVEDDLVSREIALLLLSRLGYRADVVENGTQALAALHAAAYDLVLMDLQMPEMDGIEATRRIRAELSPAGQPTVIAMTASVSTDDRTLCLEAGMDDFLSKPVHLDELAAVLGNRDTPKLSVVPPLTAAEGPVVYDPAPLEVLVADLGAEGDEVRRDLIQTFLAESERSLAAIVMAGADADGDALCFAAHALKAASGTMGLLALVSAAQSIEDRFRAAPKQMDVGFESEQLVAEYRRATAALRGALAADPGRRDFSGPPPPPGVERLNPRPG